MSSVAYETMLTYRLTPTSGLALLAHWSVCQKLNHVSSVQIRRSVRALTVSQNFWNLFGSNYISKRSTCWT